MYKYIEFHQRDCIATIAFNRPGVLNALNMDLIEETLHAIKNLSRDVRVLVIRGSGSKAFAAGADINELQRRDMWTEFDQGPRRKLAMLLEVGPFLSVAALNGVTLGGGFELALACNLRVAKSGIILGLPESRLGILPGNGGTVRLTRLIGAGRSLRLILMGEKITSDDAYKMGAVDWLLSATEFDKELDDLVKTLAQLPQIATRAIVDCVTYTQDLSMKDALAKEHKWLQICLSSDDKREGVAAFLEKRKAQFS